MSAKIHKHVIGIDQPLKKNPFYKCPSCFPNKMVKIHITRTPRHKKSTRHCTTKLNPDQPSRTQFDTPVVGEPGQHFYMDFGFVCDLDIVLKQMITRLLQSLGDIIGIY